MSLSKSILSYISEANKLEKEYRKNIFNPAWSGVIRRVYSTNNDQILRRKDVLHPLIYSKELLQKKNAGLAKYNSNRINALNTEFRKAMDSPRKMDDTEFRDAMNAPRSNNGYDGSKAAAALTKGTTSRPKTSSFWSKASNHISNHISNHKVKYGIGAGAVTAAGIGKMIHNHNKNKGILNKIKNNPGKAAGASLAALGAGAGAAALIRYLRKKKK